MKDLTFNRKESIRLRNFDYSDLRIYFVTLVVLGRRPVFNNPTLASQTVDYLEDLRNRMRFRVFCYCLMPDHFHGLFSPGKAERPWVRSVEHLRVLQPGCHGNGTKGGFGNGSSLTILFATKRISLNTSDTLR